MFKFILFSFVFIIYSQGFAIWIPPDQALKNLMEGNERYIKEETKYSNRSTERRQALVEEQKPFAVVLACSDSRGGPEIIFDQGIGDLFVVRAAGNVIGSVGLASIEYGAIYLEASLIMVLGHQNCGAIKAVIDGNTKDIEPVAELIAPAINEAKGQKGDLWVNAVKDNVMHVVKQLETHPVLSKLIKKEKLKVVGGYYDFHTGKVELLPNPHKG